MPRPRKRRCIQSAPPATFYKPQGVPMGQLRGVTLAVEGFEALRLVDAEGLSQEEAAERMEVSRPTLCRILGEARTVVAKALANGWAIRIEDMETPAPDMDPAKPEADLKRASDPKAGHMAGHMAGRAVGRTGCHGRGRGCGGMGESVDERGGATAGRGWPEDSTAIGDSRKRGGHGHNEIVKPVIPGDQEES